MTPTIVWFLVGLVLALAELAVPGVILVFFGVGAWLVALTTWLGLTASLESQLITFTIASVVLLLALRRWIKGRLYGHVSDEQDLNVDMNEFVGNSVKVLDVIEPGSSEGRVEFKGARWHAVSSEKLEPGESAVIDAVEGITLKVRKT